MYAVSPNIHSLACAHGLVEVSQEDDASFYVKSLIGRERYLIGKH